VHVPKKFNRRALKKNLVWMRLRTSNLPSSSSTPFAHDSTVLPLLRFGAFLETWSNVTNIYIYLLCAHARSLAHFFTFSIQSNRRPLSLFNP
jgi:hypothetical protein